MAVLLISKYLHFIIFNIPRGIHVSLKGAQFQPPPGNIYTGEEDSISVTNSTEALPIPPKDERLRE